MLLKCTRKIVFNNLRLVKSLKVQSGSDRLAKTLSESGEERSFLSLSLCLVSLSEVSGIDNLRPAYNIFPLPPSSSL